MTINKAELEQLLDERGIGSRTKKKILEGLDAPTSTSKARTSSGHGAATPDLTEVPSV